jgi:ABC-type cobalamin/Fe3+-siderophores transport system ATPase subunit
MHIGEVIIMSSPIQYKGTRWFKCDLHLHTTASKCFEDESVTPEQWVNKVLEQGLDCVAVTDHNTGEMIDAIKTAASGTGLTVFPGVEITCDTSKVHLLVIFDITKTTNDINDFLILCGISRDKFAEPTASTQQTIFDVSRKALESGAIVIPAHIDEHNGLSTISPANLNSFFDLPNINSVQIVHKDFLNPSLQTNDNTVLKTYLNAYYNNPSPEIDYAKIADWHRPAKIALDKNIAITTFSDNPHEPQLSKHGLNGIGSRYTWIKMDEKPTLEGLRQAFLLPDFRVKNDIISSNTPYKTPELWIKSITIKDTIVTDSASPLVIEFSPQLTTIIGGRGSGKSSILRFIRGLFNRTADLSELKEILVDQSEFYKQNEQRSQKGVLKDSSIVEVEFIRNKVLHRIIASGITNSASQTITISKFNSATSSWTLEEADGYLDFFEYEQYSQKQIFEIAQEPNSLRERIDKSISRMDELKNGREIIKKLFLQKSASIRTIQQQILGKGKLQTEIKDLDDRIKLFQQSGIASLFSSKERFAAQQGIIKDFIVEAQNREDEIDTLARAIPLPDIDYSGFDAKYSDELKPLSKTLAECYNAIRNELIEMKQKARLVRTTFETTLTPTVWGKEFDQNQADFNTKKEELEKQGIDDISNFEKLTVAKSLKEEELEKIIDIEANLSKELSERQKLQEEFLAKTKEITAERTIFVGRLLQDDKVKVSIKPFRNKVDFTHKLRNIIQRQNSFEADVDILTDLCFNGNAEQGIQKVRDIFLKIKRTQQAEEVSGYFVNLVMGMSDAQIDEIELLFPEDEIDIKYKPSGSSSFKPLATASAGQKTTAILTFILSQGNIPLLLDQPEDDLDNRLVYELIVDRLKQAKEQRQIIVVTHNANIPVNGDAEYILSMDSDSKMLKVFCSGTVEQPVIKKEICDVMEGSEQAFDMRSRRYKQI